MARNLTAQSASPAERVIAQCEAGVYERCEGSEPLDLLARGMVESATGDLETAKDLLSQAYFALEGSGKEKAGVQLSVAYWRGGEYAEAKALLDSLPESFDLFLTQAIIELESDPKRALETLARAEAYDVSRYMWGRFHNLRGICFRRLGDLERARAEYDAARYFWKDCPLQKFLDNNLGAALSEPNAAHAQIDSAIESLSGPYLAQAYDLKAQRFLEQGDYAKAEQYSVWAVGLLENTDRRAWLAECRFTYAETLWQLERPADVLDQLFKIVEVARYLSDKEMELKACLRIRDISRVVSKSYYMRSIQIAIDESRSLSAAAKKIGVSRQAVKEFMKTNNLNYNLRPWRSIITKI